jgi:predicted KAP-like P-loop ATPase
MCYLGFAMRNKLRSILDAVSDRVRSVWVSASTAAPDETSSLDSPRLDIKDDVLNRHRIAQEIYRIVTDQAANSSVRIGLFGDWGYGKTTISNWVASLAEADGHIIVPFNPWSVRDLPELWLTFITILHEALEREVS